MFVKFLLGTSWGIKNLLKWLWSWILLQLGNNSFQKSNKYIISIFLFNTCSCKGFFPSICLQIFYHFPNPFLFIQINSACRSRKDICFQNWFLCGYCVIFWEIQSWLSWRELEPTLKNMVVLRQHFFKGRDCSIKGAAKHLPKIYEFYRKNGAILPFQHVY